VLAYVVGRLGKLAKPIELEIFGLVPMTAACTSPWLLPTPFEPILDVQQMPQAKATSA
jgi:hypothetical protein